MNKKIGCIVLAVAGWVGLVMPAVAAPPEISPSGIRESQDAVANTFLLDQLRSEIEQVISYREAFKSLISDPKLGPQAKAVEGKVAALVAHSERLAASSRLAEAISAAGEAKRLVVDSIVKLRSGETVVVSLSFDNPMQEYTYEQRRFASNEAMVRMMEEEGRASDPRQRKIVDGFSSEGRRLRQLAEKNAGIGKYAEAVCAMEAASAELTKALQVMGVPVF